MTAFPSLLLALSSAVILAQESNPLLIHWNTPHSPAPAIHVKPEAEMRVVLVHESAQVDFPESTRVAVGKKNVDGSWEFLLNNTKTAQVLKFKLASLEGKPAREGTFRMFLGCGYPAFEFVNGSEAEQKLVILLRQCREAAMASKEQSSPSETLDALNTLLEYFPINRQNNKQNKPEMATPRKPSD